MSAPSVHICRPTPCYYEYSALVRVGSPRTSGSARFIQTIRRAAGRVLPLAQFGRSKWFVCSFVSSSSSSRRGFSGFSATAYPALPTGQPDNFSLSLSLSAYLVVSAASSRLYRRIARPVHKMRLLVVLCLALSASAEYAAPDRKVPSHPCSPCVRVPYTPVLLTGSPRSHARRFACVAVPPPPAQ